MIYHATRLCPRITQGIPKSQTEMQAERHPGKNVRERRNWAAQTECTITQKPLTKNLAPPSHEDDSSLKNAEHTFTPGYTPPGGHMDVGNRGGRRQQKQQQQQLPQQNPNNAQRHATRGTHHMMAVSRNLARSYTWATSGRAPRLERQA